MSRAGAERILLDTGRSLGERYRSLCTGLAGDSGTLDIERKKRSRHGLEPS